MIHKAKKSLGQNFLKSAQALKKIIEAGEVKKEDTILEIGPGKGALTEKLLENGGKVIAVEKDRELFEYLEAKFETNVKSGNLILLNEDILNFEITNYELRFARQDLASVKPSAYKIIANIPYNITGAILKKFLTAPHQPERMVLLVQKEVAQRITAQDGKESILSISVKAYGEPKMVMKVPARYFSPSPKVDSAVILIKNISRQVFEEHNTSPQPSPCQGEGGGGTVQDKNLNSQAFEERFWEIVKAGFAHKRKKLSSNLKNSSTPPSKEVLDSLGNKRAEELTLKQWITLGKN